MKSQRGPPIGRHLAQSAAILPAPASIRNANRDDTRPHGAAMYAALRQWFDGYSYKATRPLDVDAYARHPSVASVARELGYEALDMDEEKFRQRCEHAPP